MSNKYGKQLIAHLRSGEHARARSSHTGTELSGPRRRPRRPRLGRPLAVLGTAATTLVSGMALMALAGTPAASASASGVTPTCTLDGSGAEFCSESFATSGSTTVQQLTGYQIGEAIQVQATGASGGSVALSGGGSDTGGQGGQVDLAYTPTTINPTISWTMGQPGEDAWGSSAQYGGAGGAGGGPAGQGAGGAGGNYGSDVGYGGGGGGGATGVYADGDLILLAPGGGGAANGANGGPAGQAGHENAQYAAGCGGAPGTATAGGTASCSGAGNGSAQAGGDGATLSGSGFATLVGNHNNVDGGGGGGGGGWGGFHPTTRWWARG